MDAAEISKAFGAFFAVMNPFINLPIFLAMTSDFTVGQQRKLAIRIAIYSIVMCAIILFAGKLIINFFGVSIDTFRVAGGLVLTHIAWSMLNGSSIVSHHGSQAEQEHMQDITSIAFYPITFPMIVGPGTIATLIIYSGHASQISGWLYLAAILCVIISLLFIVLFFASEIGKHLSDTMRVIMTRLMGMILLAIAVEMIFAGMKASFPSLA